MNSTLIPRLFNAYIEETGEAPPFLLVPNRVLYNFKQEMAAIRRYGSDRRHGTQLRFQGVPILGYEEDA